MKLFLKILLGAVVFIALILALVFYLTSSVVQTAEDFLDALNQKEYTVAYQLLSQEFQSSISEGEFIEFIELNQLDDVQSRSWSSRSFSGSQGEVSGTVSTSTGRTMPITFGLLKEQGEWAIYSIRKTDAGFVENEGLDVPSTREMQSLVHQSLIAFATSVNAADFSGYYDFISRLWRTQTTVEELNQIFTVFIEREIDLLPLQNLTPIIEEASWVQENRMVMVRGYYPTEPSLVRFDFGYVYEGLGWKVAHTMIKIEASE